MSISRQAIMVRRIFKTGLLNFVRNAWLGVAAMAVMVITLTIILFSIIANATFANTVQTITDKIDISVFLKDSVDNKTREDLINKVKAMENVKSVTYVSKDQALEAYKKDNANNLDLLLAISQTDNPLPQTLRIKPVDVNKMELIKNNLEKPEFVSLQSEKISYSDERKEAIDKITSATKFFQKAGITSVIVFAVISMLIIFNTIQMAIFNRRDELTIMRLLGASTNFIRGPFIVESMLYGIFSGVLSLAIVNTIFSVSEKAFEASSLGILDIKFSNKYFSDNYFKFLAMQLGVGIFIGAVSSLIATRRYLKFKTSK